MCVCQCVCEMIFSFQESDTMTTARKTLDNEQTHFGQTKKQKRQIGKKLMNSRHSPVSVNSLSNHQNSHGIIISMSKKNLIFLFLLLLVLFILFCRNYVFASHKKIKSTHIQHTYTLTHQHTKTHTYMHTYIHTQIKNK